MKHLKTILIAVLMVVMAISFAACSATGKTPNSGDNGGIVIGGGGDETQTPETPGGGDETQTPETPGGGDETQTPTPPEDDETNILVVYFSCTNTTKGRAETLQSRLDADIYRIVPAVEYTSADLNYSNSTCRANREQNDPTCRPEISGRVENMAQYDVVYIGYPIWWAQAPKIIYTFLESYDFSGKTLIPFCTSGGSGMGTSGTNLHSSAPNAVWKSGCLVRSASDIDTLVNMI